jgi:hypothetical protein
VTRKKSMMLTASWKGTASMAAKPTLSTIARRAGNWNISAGEVGVDADGVCRRPDYLEQLFA